MNTQFPTTPHVARTPHPAATPFMPSVAGTAGDLCRELVARHLSFSEPERLLIKGCSYAAFASMLTLAGGIGLAASTVPFPVVPTAAILLATTAIAGIVEAGSELREYLRECRQSDALAVSQTAGHLRDEIARLRIENADLKHRFHAAGAFEGTPAVSGEVAGSRGDRKERLPATDAPNVLFPQFPNFRRH